MPPLFSKENAAELGRGGQLARNAAEAQRAAKAAAIPLQAGPPADLNTLGRENPRAREFDVLLQKLKEQLGKEREPMKQGQVGLRHCSP